MEMNSLKATLTLLIGTTALISLQNAVADVNSPCDGLSGYYGNVTLIVVGEDGKTVNQSRPNGLNSYGSCEGNQVNITYKPENTTVKGIFDGENIKWNNGTSWTQVIEKNATGDTAGYKSLKNGACNGLTGYYGNITGIVVGKDRKTVNITLAGGRPNAYGTCEGSTLTVNFNDVNTVEKGTFDGKTLKWSNGTSWTKH